MTSFQSKNLAPMRILQILAKYSDCDHPMTQAQIISHLDCDFGIIVERKTIQRHIVNLQIAGFDIVSTAKGSYLESRAFDNSELQLLMDSIANSKQIPACYAAELVNKISDLGTVYFAKNAKKSAMAAVRSHCNNKDFFYNIETLSDAIDKGQKVKFVYNRSESDGKLFPVWSYTLTLEPIRFTLEKGEYCVVCSIDGFEPAFFALDKITELTLVEAQEEPKAETKNKIVVNKVEQCALTASVPDELLYDDPLQPKVVEYVRKQGFASIVSIQRHFAIGFHRAAELLDYLREQKFIAYESDEDNQYKVIDG